MLEAARLSQVGLPVVDIEDLSSPRSSDRQAVGAGLRAACLHNGFFYISNRGIAEALVADVFSEAAAFFDLPAARGPLGASSIAAEDAGDVAVPRRLWAGQRSRAAAQRSRYAGDRGG